MTLGNHIPTMFLVYLLNEVTNGNGGPHGAYPVVIMLACSHASR